MNVSGVQMLSLVIAMQGATEATALSQSLPDV